MIRPHFLLKASLALLVASTLSGQARTWQPLTASGPFPRSSSGVAWDSTRNRLVMFAGSVGGSALSGETWEFDGQQWLLMNTVGPAPRQLCAMAYDSIRHRVVMYGGLDNTHLFGDTWTWDGTTWTLAAAEGAGPTARFSSAMAFDGSSMVLFGGETHPSQAGPFSNETWLWDGASWAQVAVNAPTQRAYHAMAFDPQHHVVVMFGGEPGPSQAALGDTWTWNGAAWASAPGGPPARTRHMMASDPASDGVVMFGGHVSPSTYFSDTWRWDGTSWASLATSGPPERCCGMMSFAGSSAGVMLFGGSVQSSVFSDSWLLSNPAAAQPPGCNTGWIVRPNMPQGRSDAQAAMDGRGHLYVVGGNGSTSAPYETASVMRYTEATGLWDVVAPMTTARAALAVASDAYGRVYAFGGIFNSLTNAISGTAERFNPLTNTWSPIAPLPAPRVYARAVASPDGLTIYVVGGQESNTIPATATVWKYDVTYDSWSAAPNTLAALALHGVARGLNGEIYAVGGPANGGQMFQVRDPATGQWSLLPPCPTTTSQIGGCTADWAGRVYVLGGYPPCQSAVWVYSPATNAWSQCASLPSAMNNVATIVSPCTGLLHAFGGDPCSGGVRSTTAWTLDTGVTALGACSAQTLPTNQPPMANAGPGMTMLATAQPTTVIQGTADDPDSPALLYRWLENGVERMPWTPVIAGTAPFDLSALPALAAGGHQFVLEVTDGAATATSAMTLTVVSVPGVTPIGCTVPEWIFRSASAPSPRTLVYMAYDSVRHRVILFGGYDGAGSYFPETWEWDGAIWTLVATSGPPRRAGYCMAFDPMRGVTVMFGGNTTAPYGAAYLNDTWEWNGSVWTQRFSTGATPAQRQGAAMAFDDASGRIIMFAGYCPGLVNDVWAWDGTAWTQVSTTGAPSPRSWCAMANDAVRHRMVIFGGNLQPMWCGQNSDETWELNLTTSPAVWTQVSSTVSPSPRHRAEMCFDSVHGVMVLFGGTDVCNTNFADTWALSNGQWSQLAAAQSPPSRDGHAVVFDSQRHEVVMFGGGAFNGTNLPALTWILPVCTSAGGSDQPPSASAGSDHCVNEGVLDALDGSGSTSPSGAALTYTWLQVAGPPVLLNVANPVHPGYFAPSVTPGGATLTFQLVVSDGLNVSPPSLVNVKVRNVNQCPVAHAGEPQAVPELGAVVLNGAMSFDPDADSLSWLWQQISGPTAVTLTDPFAASPGFMAPTVGFAGAVYVFGLKVWDGICWSDEDTVTITVSNVNHPPVACIDQLLVHDSHHCERSEEESEQENENADRRRQRTITVDEGSLVTLSGSCSSDADGDALSYVWLILSNNAGSSGPNTQETFSFTAPVVATGTAVVTVQLMVSDGLLLSTRRIEIHVRNSNAPPVCGAAVASVDHLWPPNHALVPVTVKRVHDPEGRAAAITITGVTQDEPTTGTGSGDTPEDAVIVGSTVYLRAERSGSGNGRVYVISFVASDELNQTCSGTVRVVVTKNGKKGDLAIDDGQFYSSTQ